jgi:CubicO group peptidase (beta-lactamase class C family)
MYRKSLSTLGLLLALSSAAQAMTDTELQRLVEQRLDGDRTGACFAVAVIDKTTARTVVCADRKAPRPLDADTAFEIGSVSKTMTGALLAQLVAAGKLSLDDPLSKHLPKGSKVPEFEGQPITLRHLLTHTSGLTSFPASWGDVDPANPYRHIDAKRIFATLEKSSLDRAPGSRFEYSNFAVMLLSWVVAQHSGGDIEVAFAEQLFAPLGMRSAFVGKAPAGVARATGRTPDGKPTSAWDFAPGFAGVGGVRASLNDMVRYVEAQLGRVDAPISAAIKAGHAQVSPEGSRRMGMGWMIAPLNEREVFVHEGGTGGFSSFVAFRADATRGVVVLSDTAMTSLGGLGSLALHLLDERVPLGKPRLVTTPPAELLQALAGEYTLAGGMSMTLRDKDGALEIQASGQPAFAMGYDSAGDFYPLAFDAVLRPSLEAGRASFVWMQGGGAAPAQRKDAAASLPPAPDAKALANYVGSYPLMPGFSLNVFLDGAQLKAQATGQGAFDLMFAGDDTFRADAFGIRIVFGRGDDGKVSGLELHQGGQTLRGPRQ